MWVHVHFHPQYLQLNLQGILSTGFPCKSGEANHKAGTVLDGDVYPKPGLGFWA